MSGSISVGVLDIVIFVNIIMATVVSHEHGYEADVSSPCVLRLLLAAAIVMAAFRQVNYISTGAASSGGFSDESSDDIAARATSAASKRRFLSRHRGREARKGIPLSLFARVYQMALTTTAKCVHRRWRNYRACLLILFMWHRAEDNRKWYHTPARRAAAEETVISS